ncbi:MAG: hypothetical protein O2829_00345 [Bacteroidetes bacterium]|nr:hypothetical protein [Bacteroidota bacterium]MDA1267534.1 hypothetical protein [Bacteroidota bacterium]
MNWYKGFLFVANVFNSIEAKGKVSLFRNPAFSETSTPQFEAVGWR